MMVRGGIARVLATGTARKLARSARPFRDRGNETLLAKGNRQTGALPRMWRHPAQPAAVILYGFTRGDWLHGLLAGITLAMAMLPEEYPRGAYRVSGHGGMAHFTSPGADTPHARSKRWGRPPCSVWTKPVPSPSTR